MSSSSRALPVSGTIISKRGIPALLFLHHFMLAKTVSPFDLQARVTLERWRVRETAQGDRYFVGFCVETQTGRVSTAIRSFDIGTGVGTTASGRRYLLSGWPCFDAEAEGIWARLAEQHAITETNDVSTEYLRAPKG